MDRAGADPFANDVADYIDDSGRDLSARIWGNREGLRARIDAIISDAMARGLTVEEVTTQLVRYIDPAYARSGEGRARYAANRLAGHEMSRAHSLATQQTAIVNPTGGFMRYNLGPGHSVADECTDIANRNLGYGRGVYPAQDCPLPPMHIGCGCWTEEVGVDARGMDAFVDQLRFDYGLIDPEDLSPDELAVFRGETAQIRQDVQIMFASWFRQTGVVDMDQLTESSPTVAAWVDSVNEAKRARRRGS